MSTTTDSHVDEFASQGQSPGSPQCDRCLGEHPTIECGYDEAEAEACRKVRRKRRRDPALALMQAADALTGVHPGMTHREIVQAQDVTREQLEERYEQLTLQREQREEKTDEPVRVHDPGSRGEDVRRLEGSRLTVAARLRDAGDQAGQPPLSRP